MQILVFSVLIINRLDSRSKFQMFTQFSGRHIGVPTEVHQYGFFILDEYLKFGETHRPKTWTNVSFLYLL